MKKFVVLALAASLFGFGAHADEGVKPIREVFEPNAKNFPASSWGKVAVVAWVSSSPAPLTESVREAEGYKQENREALAEYIREAAGKGAKLIITPEFGVLGYPDIPELEPEDDNFQNKAQIKPYAERVGGRSTAFFASLAKELKVYIHFGMAEDGGDGKFYNSVVAVGPDGKVVASYRKIHLFNNETDYLTEGEKITTYNSPFGKIGIIICSDVYGSFPMNDYAREKVDVLALSTSWAQFNTGWDSFVSGAKRTRAFLLAANQTYFPDSGVINPDGSAQSHIRQSTGVAYGYLPLKSTSVRRSPR